MYGSCVARDTIEFAAPGSVDLKGYVARQSLISIGSDALAHLPESMTVSSKFQERMIRADFAGGLLARVESMAPDLDVLLWDLADERHGVYRFPDDTVATRSIDTMRIPELEERFAEATLLPFGTSEHFQTWRTHATAFAQQLRALTIFERVVVLKVPWAVLTTEGDPSPWSMGVRAKEANQRYQPYYDLLRELGFRMIEVPETAVLADPQHRWGLAPFHYTPHVYRELLRQLREHGFDGFTEATA